MVRRFNESFFLQSTLDVAPALLGATLHTFIRGQRTAGRIVEVEAYLPDDAASHSYRGPSRRNADMFLSGGHAYIYLIYGMHYCMNVVTEPEGIGAAVLIRAVEPIEGLALMARRRGTDQPKNFSSGPGKVCQALGLTPRMQGANLMTSRQIWLEPQRTQEDLTICCSTRIGISKGTAYEWRFYLDDNPWVSRNPRLQNRAS